MTPLPFFQVDAFTDRPFAGNPAAVVPLRAWLDDATLQAIAAENNLAETAFTVPMDGAEADYELRWFTPELEIILCGHATLASGHVLLGDRHRLRFMTRRAGLLTVERDGEGYALGLPNWAPSPKPLPDIAAAIGGAPVESLWHEAGHAVLVYGSEAEVRALAPEFALLRPLGDVAVTATAPGRDTDVVSRVFVPGAGINEDHVTGSAHAVIASYWAQRLGRESFTAFQASSRGGHLTCRVAGDRVVLGGCCVTVIEGQLLL